MEAINYASKKVNVALKPNMDMHIGANAMFQHSALKAMDKQNMQARRFSEVPLYVKPRTPNIQVLQLFCNMVRHMLISIFKSKFPTCLQIIAQSLS